MKHTIDKELVKKRFSKAIPTYQKEAVVQKHIATQMNEVIKEFVKPDKTDNILEIGCGTGTFARLFLKNYNVDNYTMNDICDSVKYQISDLLGENTTFLPGDAENINLPEGQDMIVSCSTIQWFHNPIDFLIECKNKLASSGILAISSFAPKHFKEISTLTGCALEYISTNSIHEYLERHYDIEYCCEESITLLFNTPEEVLRHLKLTGVNSINSNNAWTKNKLTDFCTQYKDKFSNEDGKVRLTYNPIYLICKNKSSYEKE